MGPDPHIIPCQQFPKCRIFSSFFWRARRPAGLTKPATLGHTSLAFENSPARRANAEPSLTLELVMQSKGCGKYTRPACRQSRRKDWTMSEATRHIETTERAALDLPALSRAAREMFRFGDDPAGAVIEGRRQARETPLFRPWRDV